MLKCVTLFVFKQIVCKKNWLLHIKSYRLNVYESRLFLMDVLLGLEESIKKGF